MKKVDSPSAALRDQVPPQPERVPTRPFVAPKLERHERLPEVTGFSF